MKYSSATNSSLGFVLAGFGTLLFSLKSIFIKFLYAQNLDADDVLVMRMVMSLPIYLVILIWILFAKASRPSLELPVIMKIFMLGFLGLLPGIFIGSDEFGAHQCSTRTTGIVYISVHGGSARLLFL